MVTLHPPIKQPDGSFSEKDTKKMTTPVGQTLKDYSFLWSFQKGDEQELMPGKWTKKIFVDDVEVANMEFEIVK